MKKNVIFSVLAGIVGLLIGYLIFSGNSADDQDNHNHTTASGTQMWTCSMHPQIMQPEPGDCPICGMDLIPAEGGSDGLSKDQFRMTKNAVALANIETFTVGNDVSGDNEITLSGKIVNNEEKIATQTVHVSGRIEKLYINYEGEEVRKGQLIALVYAPKLVAAQQELLTAVGLKNTQPELYKAVRNKLSYWKLSDKQINTIEETGEVKTNIGVYAENSGVVKEIMVKVGNYVNEGTPLFGLVNLSTVWASFDAYEYMLPLIKEGQNIKITTNAYPDKTINAKIDFIDPILNTKLRTFKVRASVTNQEDQLKPGMFIKGKLQTKNSNNKVEIVIPKSAVLWTGERSVIYLKPTADEPIFELREITLGKSIGDYYEVIQGLDNGDEIVSQGAFTVDASAQLQGKNSMMNSKNQMKEKEDVIQLDGISAENFELVILEYLELKKALVNSDHTSASDKAAELKKLIVAIQEKGLSANEKEVMNTIHQRTDDIINTENIDKQRDYFRILSDEIILVASAIPDLKSSLFVQYCPMANNNQGAQWLSDSKEIRNPYFGEQMLNCGDVIRSLN